MLWPRERFAAVLNQAGLPVTLAALDDMAGRWAASGEEPLSPLWRDAHDLAGCICPPGRHKDGGRETAQSRVLTALTRLEDIERIEALVADIVARGLFGQGDNAAILGALALLPPGRAAELLKRIIVGSAAASFGPCADSAARAGAAAAPDKPTRLAGAAAALVAALPGDPAREPPRDPWVRRPRIKARAVVDLFNAAAPIDAAYFVP